MFEECCCGLGGCYCVLVFEFGVISGVFRCRCVFIY